MQFVVFVYSKSLSEKNHDITCSPMRCRVLCSSSLHTIRLHTFCYVRPLCSSIYFWWVHSFTVGSPDSPFARYVPPVPYLNHFAVCLSVPVLLSSSVALSSSPPQFPRFHSHYRSETRFRVKRIVIAFHSFWVVG